MVLGLLAPSVSQGCDSLVLQAGVPGASVGLQLTRLCKDHKNHDCSICLTAKLNGMPCASFFRSFTASNPLASGDYNGEWKLEPVMSRSTGGLSATASVGPEASTCNVSMGHTLPLPVKFLTPLGFVELELGANVTLFEEQASVPDGAVPAPEAPDLVRDEVYEELQEIQRAVDALSSRHDFSSPLRAHPSCSGMFQDRLPAASFSKEPLDPFQRGASSWDMFAARDMLDDTLTVPQPAFHFAPDPEDSPPRYAEPSPAAWPSIETNPGLFPFSHLDKSEGLEAELEKMKLRPNFVEPNLSRMPWDDTASRDLEKTLHMLEH